MMGRFGIEMKVNVDRSQLLSKLQKNREQHGIIVKEARKGYVASALKAVSQKKEDLESGKLISLRFNLHPPEDHTEAYDTVIQMLEWSTDSEIEIEASEFRQLVMDEWDWSETFYAANKRYSPTADSIASVKGY